MSGDSGNTGRGAVRAVPLTRVVGRSAWLTPLLVVVAGLVWLLARVVLASSSGDETSGLTFVVHLVVLGSVAWVPAFVLVGLVAGTAAGVVGMLRFRPGRIGAIIRCALAALAAAAVVLAGLALVARPLDAGLGGSDLPLTGSIVLGAGTAGALALGLPSVDAGTGRIAAVPPARARGWWLGTVALACLAWLVFLWQVFAADGRLPGGGEQPCAGTAADPQVHRARIFPPQAWCVSREGVVAAFGTGPTLLAVGLLVATVLAGTVAVYLGVAEGNRARLRGLFLAAGAAILALGGAGAAVSAVWTPAPLTGREAAASAGAPAGPDASGPGLGPSPSASARASEARVRASLEHLSRLAAEKAGRGARWTTPPSIARTTCTSRTGAEGQALELTGTFTTGDLSTAPDDAAFNEITQQNERAASRIVASWSSAAALTDVEPLHGEWDLSAPDPDTLGVVGAHVGFTDGRTTLRARGVCSSEG